MNWTLLLALYGAFLSTINAYRALTTDWPRIMLTLHRTVIEENGIVLGIKNESSHSIVIHKIIPFPKSTIIRSFGAGTTIDAVSSAMNQVLHQDLQNIIEPSRERSYSLDINPSTTRVLLVVFWSSARLSLFPRFPLIVFLRQTMLEAARRRS